MARTLSIYLALMIAGIFLLHACGSSGNSNDNQNGQPAGDGDPEVEVLARDYYTTSEVLAPALDTYPVTWYKGYALFMYFENGKQAETVDDIRHQLKQRWKYPVEIKSKKEGTIRTVGSCEDFFQAQKDRIYPMSNIERREYSIKGLSCIAAQIITNGTAAKTSYIENLKVDGSIASRLPGAVTYRVNPRQPVPTSGSWADVVKLEATRVTDGEVKLDTKSTYHFVSKIATGDFNGDGNNDILLLIMHGVKEGTHFLQDLYLMTRDTPDGLLKILKTYSALERP